MQSELNIFVESIVSFSLLCDESETKYGKPSKP